MSENKTELFDLNQFLTESAETQDEQVDDKVEEQNIEVEDALVPTNAEDDNADMSPELEEFCLQCMRMYANVHLWHLQTGSYAEHEALEEYYESLFELTDSFIESAIANNGSLSCDTSFNLELLPYGELVDEIEAFKEYVLVQKGQLSEEGMINILDDVITETDEVLYKLKNLS